MTTAVSRPGLHPPRKPDEETDEERIYNNVSFASDAYVPWIIGSLRLGKADLSRMRTSGVPVLRSHQPDNLVGAVTRVEKRDGLWRSNWRLPKIPANRDTFDQMDHAVLRGISVGGNLLWETLVIDNPDEANIDDVLLTCDWLLVEESLTSIPADVTSGIDRTAAEVLERSPAIFDTVISGGGHHHVGDASYPATAGKPGTHSQPSRSTGKGGKDHDCPSHYRRNRTKGHSRRPGQQ